MKKKHKLSLLLATTATVATPLIMSGASTAVITNNSLATTKNNLSAILKPDKVIFQSNMPGVTFTGKTVIKVEPGSLFATINKPVAHLDGSDFAGWYSIKDGSEHKWEDTDKIDEEKTGDLTISIYPKFIASNVDYCVNVSDKDYAVMNPDALYNNDGNTAVMLKSLDGSSSYLRLYPRQWATNMPITIGKNVAKIDDGFLSGFAQFNSKITFAEGSRCVLIGNDFGFQMRAFDQPLLLPNNLLQIGDNFLKLCTKFNRDITIPSSVTSVATQFMYACNSMVSTLTIHCTADAFQNGKYTCATNSADAACYTTGISIDGTYADAFISRFENRTATPFRKLVNRNFTTCDWSYIKNACATYESSAQDAAAEAAFCGMFNTVTVDKWDSTNNKWVPETINKPTTMDQFVGATKTMEVNGINHILRVIGVKHDTLANGSSKKSALTFEFKTLLSDSNGNSIACPWYWEEGDSSKNYDYRKSNVYYALEHDTTYGAVDAGWYYFDTNTNAPSATKATSTQGDYYNKSVLQMLPIEPVQVIKKVVTTNSEWTSADKSKDATEYNAKVFLPTAKEIVFGTRTIANNNEGEQYALWSQYTGSPSASSIPLLIHKQIDTSTVKTDSTLITDGKHNEAKNRAGHNETIGDTGNGSTFWLSSPAINKLNEGSGWAIRFNGGGTAQFGYDPISPISPHFCL